jgi:hypothetical protein
VSSFERSDDAARRLSAETDHSKRLSKEAHHHMRALKVTLALAGLLAVFRYVPVYYYTAEFNDFVKQETQRTRSNGQLKPALLSKAKQYSLPVNEDDINITTTGSVLRVAVAYRVPVDFYFFQHKLAFHTVASIWFRG